MYLAMLDRIDHLPDILAAEYLEAPITIPEGHYGWHCRYNNR